MGREWVDITLGDVLTLQRGFDLPESERRPGAYPVIASTGPVGTHDEAMVKGPGVVIGRSGSLGGGQFIACDFWPLNTTLWVKDFKGNDPRFCYYLLKSLDLGQFNAGSGVPTLNRNHIHPLPVTIPKSSAEQRAIAHILGTLDDKIELNRRMSETLEAMARALFKAWFVDFEPVRAKMEGRWRRGESLPGLPAHLYDLFPDHLVDSELGEIPEGWEVATFGDVVELLRETENPVESPHVVFSHFSIPAYDEGQWPKREVGDNIKSLKLRVPAGTVLLSKLNPEIERVWLVDVQQCDRAICSTEFLVLAPRAPYGRSYVYCLARSRSFGEDLRSLATGTSKSHQRAQASAILGLTVIRPPESLLSRFENGAGPFLASALEWRRESRTLAALRDALLPKLISGEIRVTRG
jgi:type I restriction enzyme S subunit